MTAKYDSPDPAPGQGPWQGMAIERHHVAPNECHDYRAPACTIDVHLSRPYQLEWKAGMRYRRTTMTTGALCITPMGEPVSLRWQEDLEIIRATLSPSLLNTTAESLKLRGAVTVPERHGDADRQVAHLCQALWMEAAAGYPLGRVYGESVGVALASCLLQRYGDVSIGSATPGKLSPRIWKTLQEFVDERLQTDIRLEEMAQVARLSPYHFSRCFKETAGTSPHQYLIARRVERARRLIESANLSLAEVARQSGFADQSHLTRHMKRVLGQTPSALMPRRKAH